MTEQVVNFRLKATNDASAELVKVAAEMRRLNHEAVTSRAGVTAWGNAWGSASQGIAGGAKNAAGGIDSLNQAAKGMAAGGFQQMLSTIPGVGGALAQLSDKLGGTTLVLGGLAGAGFGALKFLQDLGNEATTALAKVTALGEGMEARRRQMLANIGKLDAEFTGDKRGAVEADARGELAAIDAAKKKRIDAAKAELDQVDLFGRKRRELSVEALNEIADAEQEAAYKTVEINRRKRNDLKKIEDDRVADEKKNADERVKTEAEAARKIVEDTKAAQSAALGIFKDLGADFADVTKSLEVAEFVTKSKDAMAELGKALQLGVIDQAKFDAGTAALTKRMQEAIALGYVPTVEAAEKVAEAVTIAADATTKASDSIAAGLFKVGAATDDTIATLDALIAKGQAVQAAMAAAGRGGPAPIGFGGGGAAGAGGTAGGSGLYAAPYGGSVLGSIIGQAKGSGLTPFNPAYAPALTPAERGGHAGGPGGIFAPSGMPAGAAITSRWTDVPAGAGPVPNSYTINLAPGAIQQSGTVISQDRDWDTLVRSIAQSIAAQGG